LELEIEVIGKGNNVKKGVVNPRISKEEEMAKVTMEVQAKSLEITASVLEKINILVEREEESVLAI
jgi:2-hydroxy-3-keto-5-methylthiopentenyl-1-phosphate phosphatase